MVEIKFELESSLSQKNFFNIHSDPEYTQKLAPEILNYYKLISKDGEGKTYEEHTTFKGFRTKSIVKHIIDFPRTHEFQIIDGDSKGSVTKETFESLPNYGSKLTIEADIQLSGPFKMMGLVAKKMMQKSLKEFYVILESSQRKHLHEFSKTT